MNMAKKETAVSRARVFPSTYEKLQLRVIRKHGGRTVAEVVEDILHKATLYEKLLKQKKHG
jgi:hypothetical protein